MADGFFTNGDIQRGIALANRPLLDCRTQLLAIALKLNPDADDYHHDDVMATLGYLLACDVALQAIARHRRCDPEGYMPDQADAVLGELLAAEKERDELRKANIKG